MTASLDKAIRVWEAVAGQPLTEPLRHPGEVVTAQFSPDGQHVLTVDWDNAARLWEVPAVALPVPDWLPEMAEAIALKRLNDRGKSESIPPAKLQEMKQLPLGQAGKIWTPSLVGFRP
jgi:WD40 repeat protein